MRAVFKREFRSYFNNMIGYVIVAVFTFFFGLYYCLYNLYQGYPYFGYALSPALSYMMILIPILTMRCLSDERKSKTDQMLLTAPLSVTKLVLGKYFAMYAVFLVPMLISCVYPLLLGRMTYHSYIIDYSCILAFTLLGGVHISIGMFLSSLTESQIIAAVLSFSAFFMMRMTETLTQYIPADSMVNAIGFCLIALLLCIVINYITKNLYASVMTFTVAMIAIWAIYYVKKELYYGSIKSLLGIISFSDGIAYFVNGIFDVTAIIMYLSVIFFFVFLTVQSVQKRRYN